MKKTFNFGKIDYNHTGRRENLVTVTIEYEEKNGKKVFTASGDIWNRLHTDIISGGQNLDTIAKYIKTPVFKEIYRLWKTYHLNDMNPGCKHQRAAGWSEIAGKRVNLYKFILKGEIYGTRRTIESDALSALKRGETVTLSEDGQKILNLKTGITSPSETLPEEIRNFYKPNGTESKLLGWLKPEEHPNGILCKPCPVCGYKYGTSWIYEPIPEEDGKIILDLMEA